MEYVQAIGHGGNALSDRRKTVMEANVTVTYADGTWERWVLTGEMRGKITSDCTIYHPVVGFEFQDPASAEHITSAGEVQLATPQQRLDRLKYALRVP